MSPFEITGIIQWCHKTKLEIVGKEIFLKRTSGNKEMKDGDKEKFLTERSGSVRSKRMTSELRDQMLGHEKEGWAAGQGETFS